MTRRFMLDTNMVSYIVSGKSLAARTRLESLSSHELPCISSITEAELRFGLARINNPRARHIAAEWFLGRLPVLSWTSKEAAVYGPLRAKQEASGKSLDNLDMLIAAHAVSTGSILVSRDSVFRYVPDLPGVENWATDL